jgi:hypothetical protein
MKIEDCKIGMHVASTYMSDRIGTIVSIKENDPVYDDCVEILWSNAHQTTNRTTNWSCRYIEPAKNNREKNNPPHSHYFKDVSHFEMIDIYRVLELFGVTDQKIGHAVKKLLCAGQRGQKDIGKDIQEAIDSLERWKSMREEDVAATPSATSGVLDDRTRESIMSKINEWERVHNVRA